MSHQHNLLDRYNSANQRFGFLSKFTKYVVIGGRPTSVGVCLPMCVMYLTSLTDYFDD